MPRSGLLGNIDGALLEGSGVLAQQLVGGVGDGALGLHGLLAVGDAQGQDHLVFPQGDGVDDGGLDLLGHHRVIALDQADLRAHLDGDVAGQLQVVQLLLKAVTQVGQVAGSLSILGQLGALGFLLRSLQVGIAHLLQLLLPARMYIVSSLK